MAAALAAWAWLFACSLFVSTARACCVTRVILWVNGLVASRWARSPRTQRPADFEWKRTGVATLPDVLEFIRHRLPWPFVTAAGASLLAMLVAWGEVHNWGVFLRFLYQVPYGANDPLYDKDIGFYLFVATFLATPADDDIAIRHCGRLAPAPASRPGFASPAQVHG
jgi:uncharacterized membrane protein (UPF0182 family)